MTIKTAAHAAQRVTWQAGVAALLVLLAGAGYPHPAARAAEPRGGAGLAAGERPAALAIGGGTQKVTQTYYPTGNPSGGSVIDTQSVTLDAGNDVPVTVGLSRWHYVDLKWTITNTTTCKGLAPGQSCGPTPALRYPGMACVNGTGQPVLACGGPGWDTAPPSNDPGLGCKSHPVLPQTWKPHASITICTTSVLSSNEAASQATYFMGVDTGDVNPKTEYLTDTWQLSDPWNPRVGKPAPITYRFAKCEGSASVWHGTVPPSCALARWSGPLRRVYSAPGYFGTADTATLPAQSDVAHQLPGFPALKSQAGYVYLEAWVRLPGQREPTPAEFGLTYHDGDGHGVNVYSLYWSLGGLHTYGIFVPAGATIRLAMYANPGKAKSSAWPAEKGCATPADCLTLRAWYPKTGQVIFNRAFPAAGWSGNGMQFARVTSIAQQAPGTPGNIFTDGAVFGPIRWSDPVLATQAGTAIKVPKPPWNSGGTQSWPTDPTRVIVTGPGLAGETDTLYLHP